MIVRLKVLLFQTVLQVHRQDFNSMIVRLKEIIEPVQPSSFKNFNSMIVRLKES